MAVSQPLNYSVRARRGLGAPRSAICNRIRGSVPALLLMLVTLSASGDPDVLERARDLRGEDPHAALSLLNSHIGESDEFESIGDEPEQARSQAQLLEVRAGILRDIGRREEARNDAARLERIAESLQDPVRQAQAQFLRGTIQAELGDIAGAMERFHAARVTLEATDATIDLARVTNALGVAHNFTENHERARDYYEQALELVRRTDGGALESSILGNLALVIGELEGVEAGLAAHREALALARERDDTETVANQLANICSRLVEADRLDEAATTCLEALARVTRIGNSRLIAGTQMSLGDLERARGRLGAAKERYQTALELAENRVPSVEVAALDKLVQLDEQRGEPALALDRLRQLMQLREELLERERASLVEELEVRYQVEQKEREIRLLELDRELQAAELRQRSMYLVGSIVALILVSLLALVAWRGFTVKSRLERQLAKRHRELGEALEMITQLAREDSLTGLLNRRGLLELAEREIQRSRRTSEPLSLVMADIDDFKQLNDQYGHAIGDEVLRHLARRIEQAVRELDIIGRWGGEEFVFLLPRTDIAEARHVVERVRRQVVASPIDTEDGAFPVTLTFGIARVDSDIEEAVEKADQAMYRGKNAGRDRIVGSDDNPVG